jgi:hypothetical protein
VLFIVAIAQLSKRMHRLGADALIVSTVKNGAAAGGAAVHRLGCAVLQRMGATALTIDGFMTQVRARHSQSLTAYYMATAIFAVMVAGVLLMAGAPASWCASMPLASAVAVAALFLVQSPPAIVGTVPVPGSQMVMALQAVLVGGWCAGTVPTDVVLAPLPAVAVYVAAAYAVTRKLRSRELSIFLLIIIVLAGSVPASFIHIPAADLEPALITTPPTPLLEEPDGAAAAALAVAYHATPSTVMSSAATATASATTSMACAAMALLKSNIPSELLPGCGIQLPPALRKQLALEGDYGEWMHDNGAGNKHITPFITDFAEWTSSTRTTLGGIGADALVCYGTGNVRMMALDTLGRPYCYTLYDVRYVPMARVRLLAAIPEMGRNVHMDTETMTQKRPHAEGTVHIPFTVRQSHFWTKSVIIHNDRIPLLPKSSRVPQQLRAVSLRAARAAANDGGIGCLVSPPARATADTVEHKVVRPSVAPSTTGGSSDALLVTRPAAKGGSSAPTAPALLRTEAPTTKGGSTPPAATAQEVAPTAVTTSTAQPLQPHVVPPAPVSTIPFVEMFSGVGSASHYLKQWFHPTAAFDSDPAAQAVMAKHFPACAMAADCESILAGGEDTTKFAAAAKSARVAFGSPPCSQTSVVNKQRDESSPTAMLSVTVLKLLEYFRLHRLLCSLQVAPPSHALSVCRCAPTFSGFMSETLISLTLPTLHCNPPKAATVQDSYFRKR